jgi:7-cyano-7-deazaguanine synthase
MADTVLVLHSGGLDSTTCLFSAQSEGNKVISLGVDYSQRASVELAYAANQCQSREIERHVVKVEWERPARSLPFNRTIDEIRKDPSPAFLPGRNALFLSIALAHAAGVKATRILIGINCVDFSGYPDCTSKFLESFSNMAKEASPQGAEISAPLLNMSKPEIARKAQGLGIKPGETWSCYRPKIVAEGIVPCEICDACKLHRFAWSGV